jgi:F-type H+-transporting ATPase subunit delta
MTTSASVVKAKAAVYAQVLLETAVEQGTTKVLALTSEFDRLLKTVRGSIELRNALTDTGIPANARRAIAAEVFAGFDPSLLEVFSVMIEREELDVLGRANAIFLEKAEQALKAVIIDVATVVALDDRLRKQIVDKYSTELGSGVLLREHIDPSLVGGIVLSLHGKRIDASVLSQLESARLVLSKQ